MYMHICDCFHLYGHVCMYIILYTCNILLYLHTGSLTLCACAAGVITVRSRSVSVCVSVNSLTATYLVYTLKIGCRQTFHDDLNTCIVWIWLKTLCTKVLATVADHLCLLLFFTNSRWTNETAMASFQEEQCVNNIAIVHRTRLIHHWLQQTVRYTSVC